MKNNHNSFNFSLLKLNFASPAIKINSYCSSILKIFLVSVFIVSGISSIVSAEDKKEEYPKLGVDAGVWNDGQAALWDLNIIDHFHYFGPSSRAKGYKPKQPINFSHVTHVQKNKIECQFCHWNVAKSPYASIPEVETCAGCHNVNKIFLAGRTEEQQKEIAKLHEYIKSGEPIPWEKVHVMPDHVRFNHKRHVKAGVSCQSCHGQIPEMEVVERVSSMKMGWCVDCHRQKGTSIDCLVCHK